MYVLNGITLIHVIFEKKLEEKMSKVSKTKKGFWGVFLFYFLVAFALNQYTIYSLYADYEVNSAVVSLCKTTKEQRDNIVAIAKENPKVQSYLSDVEEGAPELLYILPTEWFAAEIPMNGVLYRAGHRSSQEYDDMKYKVIFTVPELKGEQNISGQEILNSAKGIEGKVEVWVDLELGEVISLYEIPETVKYEGVPVAIY